jgi:hypothetical protein
MDSAILEKFKEYSKANAMNPRVAEGFLKHGEDIRLSSLKHMDDWAKSKTEEIADKRSKADIIRLKNEVGSSPESFALGMKALENNIIPRLANAKGSIEADLVRLEAQSGLAKQHLDAAVKDRSTSVLETALKDPLMAELVTAKELDGYKNDLGRIYKEQENIAISEITDRLLDSKMNAEQLKGKAMVNLNDHKAWTDLGLTAKKMVRDVSTEIDKTKFETNPRVKAARMKALTAELKDANSLVNFADNQGDEVAAENRRAAKAMESAARALQASAKREEASAHRQLKGEMSLNIFKLREMTASDPKANMDLVSSGLSEMEGKIKELHKSGGLSDSEFVASMGHVRSAQTELKNKVKSANKSATMEEKIGYAFELNNKISEIQALAANPSGKEDQIKKKAYDLLTELGEKRRDDVISIREFNTKTNTLSTLVSKNARRNGWWLMQESEKSATERELNQFNHTRSKVDFRNKAVDTFRTKTFNEDDVKTFDFHLDQEMSKAEESKAAFERANGPMSQAKWQKMLDIANGAAATKAAIALRNNVKNKGAK